MGVFSSEVHEVLLEETNVDSEMYAGGCVDAA